MTDQSTPSRIHLSVETGDQRLDRFIVGELPELSRSVVQRLIKAGDVLVNQEATKPAYCVEPGDQITILLAPPVDTDILPEDIPLEILYEDADLAAINKPAGMVVHPAFGNWSGTVVNAALARWPQMREVGEVERAGIVHRLDKDTSGLLVLAKTPEALTSLQAQFKARTVTKQYIALVEGIPTSSGGIIDAPIGRDPKQRKRMAVVRDGRPAQTRYDVLEDFNEHALLLLELYSGRTHQIRVHLAWLGYPIVGDRVYGYRKQRIKMKRLFLHAVRLAVDSPSSGQRLQFEAPLPASLEDILAKLRRAAGSSQQ